MDPAFIKEMLVAVAKNWNGSDSGKVELQALLPEGERKKLDAAFEESAKELLAAGVEVGWSKEVKTGFKVGAKEGGYISFADADIEALLASTLRDRCSNCCSGVSMFATQFIVTVASLKGTRSTPTFPKKGFDARAIVSGILEEVNRGDARSAAPVRLLRL